MPSVVLQVLVGFLFFAGICAIPYMGKKTKPGHGLLDSEKPQDIQVEQDKQHKARVNVTATDTQR